MKIGRHCALKTCGHYFTTGRETQQYCCAACWHTAQREGRISSDYRRWKSEVIARDGAACRICRKTAQDGVKLIAHHVLEVNSNPEARLLPANGMTLCTLCHEAIHGRVGESNPQLIFGREQRRLATQRAKLSRHETQ